MRKLTLLMAALISLSVVSCKKDLGDVVKPVALTIAIAYEEDLGTLGLPKDGALVKITHLGSGDELDATTNAEGLAVFGSVLPGKYTITVSKQVDAAVYSQLSGTYVTRDLIFNGNVSNQEVTQQQARIEVSLVTGAIGNWVFKQIYYAGSNTSSGASFRDQFFELYNNSDEVLYADSLYFGQTYASNTAITTNNAGKPGYLDNSQFDWSQARDANNVLISTPRANEDYVYVRSMFMIPGTGKQHPVQPGQSIIVAQTALNHTAPYQLNDGTQQGITDPTLTVDLSGAQFEAYLVDFKRSQAANPGSFSPYKFDVDNPGVPNLEVISFASGNELIIDNLGRESLIIFEAKDVDPRTWKGYAVPTVTNVTSTTTLYPQVPVSYIIDAVELQRVVENQRGPKRLPNSLDAGPTNVSGGEYSSQSLVRKTIRTVDGRRILQDTNNSANDFVTKTKADPSRSAASFNN